MNPDKLSNTLFEKGFISATQLESVNDYRSKTIFSVRKEIFFLLFSSIMLFTSGAGIVIYKNIDTIGHVAILSLILIVTLGCYYYSFKHAPGFSKLEVPSQKPLYDYLVLAANLLTGIFIAYLQYQYSVFGTHYDLAIIVPTLIYFFSAYYFDHKGALSLAITGLCAFIGFTASPTGLLRTNFSTAGLGYSAIITAVAFVLWSKFAEREGLKKHFNFTYENFALHIFSIACISLMAESIWIPPFLILAAGTFYFITLAYQKKSAYFFVFAFVYGYSGLTMALGRIIFSWEMNLFLVYLSPFYFVGAILLFIKCLKDLKKRKHESI